MELGTLIDCKFHYLRTIGAPNMKTQKFSHRELVKSKLEQLGRVDTALAKSLGISRLPVQIERLRKQGMKINLIREYTGSMYYMLENYTLKKVLKMTYSENNKYIDVLNSYIKEDTELVNYYNKTLKLPSGEIGNRLLLVETRLLNLSKLVCELITELGTNKQLPKYY